MQYYRLGAGWIESCLTEKFLKGLTDKLNVSGQRTLAAKSAKRKAGRISRILRTQQVQESNPSLGAVVRLRLQCCVQCWAPQYKTLADGVGPAKADKPVRAMEHTVCKEMLGEARGLSSLQRRGLRGDPTALFTYLGGGRREDGASLLGGTW